MNVQLIPEGFRNSTFEENLELLSAAYPEIYKLVADHKPASHRLCLNPDGTPNIVYMPDKTVLYPASGEEIDALNGRKVLGMARKVDFPGPYLLEDEGLQAKNSPVQNLAYSELLDITPMGITEVEGTDGQTRRLIEPQDSAFLPFVRVYGVGLGTQLLTMLKEKRVNYVSVIEPDVDLFFSSLFVIPWSILHQYFSVRGNRLSLIVGDTPENSIKRERAFINQSFPFLTSNFGLLTSINDDAVLERLLSAAEVEDAVSYRSSTAGWYDDQKIGLFHSLRNIKIRRRVFTGEKVNGFFRVFIIGSGPSLDNSIPYIRQHCDQAIIFACGTAITPLLDAGIVPDFHVVQERFWSEATLPNLKNKHLLRQIRLLKLNVVCPENDYLYKEVYVFQKFMDPGSALMGAGFPATQGVNPTVTNAGVAFALELGADEVYLFGVDYGSGLGGGGWHSSKTIYDTEGVKASYADEDLFETKGNFGVSVMTTPALSWSKQVTEKLIGRNTDVKFFNVGDGASITGAAECRMDNLAAVSVLPNPKADAVKKITACFSDEYISEECFQNFDEVHRPSIKAYLENLRLFHDTPVTTREEITHVLSTLYEAVDIGLDKSNFMPSSLLSGGIKRLVENVHLQSSFAASDADAVKFYEKATLVLDEYYADVLEDLDRLVDSANNGVDIVSWS